MRIAQIIARNASEYEKKCQRVDRVAMAAEHEIVDRESEADVVHVYGSGVRRPRRRWFPIAAAWPPHSITPLPTGANFVPEAVEEQYLAPAASAGNGVGVFVRPSIRDVLELTRIRLHRTRDDVVWHLFDRVPTPADIAQVAVWFDPAVADDDFDGFVAEAMAMGRLVVAARTPINVQRLEKGRTGFLVPQRDANEMTHAILAALFKPEIGRPRSDAARQTVSKFRPRQRVRALTGLYERLRS
jgi:hypothetical protein